MPIPKWIKDHLAQRFSLPKDLWEKFEESEKISQEVDRLREKAAVYRNQADEAEAHIRDQQDRCPHLQTTRHHRQIAEDNSYDVCDVCGKWL